MTATETEPPSAPKTLPCWGCGYATQDAEPRNGLCERCWDEFTSPTFSDDALSRDLARA